VNFFGYYSVVASIYRKNLITRKPQEGNQTMLCMQKLWQKLWQKQWNTHLMICIKHPLGIKSIGVFYERNLLRYCLN